jgi:prevent-host-death family protein
MGADEATIWTGVDRLAPRRWTLPLLALSGEAKRAPVSRTELSERAEELVRSVHGTGDAVVVLQGGEPVAVLVGANEFAALREYRRFLRRLAKGLRTLVPGVFSRPKGDPRA